MSGFIKKMTAERLTQRFHLVLRLPTTPVKMALEWLSRREQRPGNWGMARSWSR
jgi:hypothetical protein